MTHYSILFLIAGIAAAQYAYSGVYTDAEMIGKMLALIFLGAYAISIAVKMKG